jgi:hypothetical protein
MIRSSHGIGRNWRGDQVTCARSNRRRNGKSSADLRKRDIPPAVVPRAAADGTAAREGGTPEVEETVHRRGVLESSPGPVFVALAR